MSAYLVSEDLPVVLLFENIHPQFLETEVRNWMAGHKVLSVPFDDGTRTYASFTVNFNVLLAFIITTQRPESSKPVIEVDANDL